MSYDYRKLRGRIKERFGTQEKFAEVLRMSPVALSQRLNNVTKFTQDEISKSCQLLAIPDAEIRFYFFTRKVQKS